MPAKSNVATPLGPGGPFAGSVINVRDYGAQGNDKLDDSDALEAAITASQEGDALYFPAGTYLISRPLEPKAYQLYFSLCDNVILRAHGETGFPMIVIRHGPAEFAHLTINGSRNRTTAPQDPATAAGIWRPHDADGLIRIVVTDCRVQNTHGDGVHVAGGDSDPAFHHVVVRDTFVDDCGINGLGFGRVAHVRVESSRFERCYNGIKMLDCDDVVVHGVTASANRRHGIVFQFSHRWHVDNCVARRNGSEEDRGWGIAAGGEPISGVVPNSDFTITNNICEGNADGGITIDPTTPPDENGREKIWPQRARVSGNICRRATLHHGIQVTHGSDVVITDNVCTDNENGSGIQVLTSRHVLVQGNTCCRNRNGIGLFSNEFVTDPGHHVIGINLLYGNTEADVRHQESGQGQPLSGVRIYGLHGEATPEGAIQAEPGTLYEWHRGDAGALYVKQAGTEIGGWRRAATVDTP